MLLLKCYSLSLWACLSPDRSFFSKTGHSSFPSLSSTDSTLTQQVLNAAISSLACFQRQMSTRLFFLTVTRALADSNAADAGLQGEAPQEVVLSWDITCFPCLWCSCSYTSPAPSGMITTCLAWTDLWVSDSLSFCSSLPCWSPSERRHNCVSICPMENSQNDVYSMCQHAVRPRVAVKSGNFKGSVLQTLLWLDSCFYCYSDEIMPSHE